MAYSGTYGFMMTRDDIISGALRLTTRFGSGDSVPVEDMSNCAQALNILCKELATEGLPLWCVTDYSIPLVAGQSTYNISTILGMQRPIKITDAYLRYSTGNDVSLTIESRYDYDKLGQKSSQGTPNQLFYDPQLGASTVTLYNVPADPAQTLHLVIQRQIMDVNLSTDNPDFPQEAYRLLKWCLADEIALEYSAPASVRQELSAKAMKYRMDFFAFEQEQAPVFFTPTMRGQGG